MSKPDTNTKKRLPRGTRAAVPPRMQLQERDIQILEHLVSYLFLNTGQFRLLLDGKAESKSRIEDRLKLLYHHQYVERVQLPAVRGSAKLVYCLQEKGAALISTYRAKPRAEIDWNRHRNRVKSGHIEHLLGINDLLICFGQALAKAKAERQISDFKLERGEPQKHRLSIIYFNPKTQKREERGVVPDALLRIFKRDGSASTYFLELDRGTIAPSRWPDKVLVYREYRSEKPADCIQRFGSDAYMVLVVVPSERRLLSLAERTVAVGSFNMFAFTAQQQVQQDITTNPIWYRAGSLFERRNEKVSQVAKLQDAKRLALLET